MLLVWGRGDGSAVMGDTPAVKCVACGETAARTAVVEFSYWHIWYLFSFLTGREYRTVCKSCGAAAPMEKADARAAFPKDNIPFIRKRGWAVCLALVFALFVSVSVSRHMDGERVRGMLEAPVPGDAYYADLSRVRDSGYAFGGDAMYGAMLLVDTLEDGRFVVATSDVAYEKKSGLKSALRKDLEYSVSGNAEGEPLALSREELAALWETGVLYGGERGEGGGASESAGSSD